MLAESFWGWKLPLSCEVCLNLHRASWICFFQAPKVAPYTNSWCIYTERERDRETHTDTQTKREGEREIGSHHYGGWRGQSLQDGPWAWRPRKKLTLQFKSEDSLLQTSLLLMGNQSPLVSPSNGLMRPTLITEGKPLHSKSTN